MALRDRASEMEALWADGLTVQQIADRIGSRFHTVNSLICDLRREGHAFPKRVGPRKPIICKNCGESFIYRSNPQQKFCSHECASAFNSGDRSHRFKGGLGFYDGRWTISCRGGGFVHYSRAVVEAELRRPLRSDEIVHHRNEDTGDDRVENLQVVTRAEHARIHAEERNEARNRWLESRAA